MPDKNLVFWQGSGKQPEANIVSTNANIMTMNTISTGVMYQIQRKSILMVLLHPGGAILETTQAQN